MLAASFLVINSDGRFYLIPGGETLVFCSLGPPVVPEGRIT